MVGRVGPKRDGAALSIPVLLLWAAVATRTNAVVNSDRKIEKANI